MSIHRFNDSSTACDANQMSGDVKFGDTLVVESEGVVAMACTYSFAVTAAQGEFYNFTWDDPITDPNDLLTLVNGIRAAVAEAKRLGIAINPAFIGFAETQS